MKALDPSSLPEPSILSDPDAYAALTPDEKKERWAGVLPGTKAESQARASAFLESLLAVGHHDIALASSGANWPLISAYITRHPGFRAEYELVRQAIEIRRQPRAEDESHRRAVDGWEKPVWGSAGHDGGTVQIGVERVYSDRLLLKELEAGNRPKYAPPQQAPSIQAGGNVTITYHAAISREANPAPTTPPETATKVAQEPIEGEFTEELPT